MKKILVVDDQQYILVLIEAILKGSLPDYQIFLSLSGQKAINLAREHLPDTILLDIMMPKMNGFEVCKILKNDPLTQHIPIIMVSALGQELESRLNGLKAGADAFLAKPFNKSELTLQVKIMLRIKDAEHLLKIQNNNLEVFIKNQTRDFNDFKNMFLQISEFALEFFWEVDSNGLITYASPGIENILGYKSADFVGSKHLYDIYSPVEKEKTKAFFSEIVSTKKSISNVQQLCLHKNGFGVWLAISGFPIFNAGMDYVGYRGVCQDVTLRVNADIAQRKNLEEIKAYQQKLKTLNSELILAEERERRKIAEYLHDGISQTLSITNMKLTSLLDIDHSAKTQKIIQESSNSIKDSIAKSRLLTYDLSPPILYEVGLIAAIRWKLNQIKEKYKIDTDFQNNGHKLEINDDVKILLYRSICELLINIIKHAEAHLIKIEITEENEYVCISVNDNGKGFVYQPRNDLTKKGGFGLFSISERLELIDGSITIRSEIGKGTNVILKIPVNKD